MVDTYGDFVWRTLQRLGVRDADLEDVEMAWSDVPLVPDPAPQLRCALELSEEVARKQRGVATATWRAR